MSRILFVYEIPSAVATTTDFTMLYALEYCNNTVEKIVKYERAQS